MLSQEEQRIVDSVDPEEVRRIAVQAARIPSYRPPYGLEQDIAEMFAGELKRAGVDAELQEVESSRPNVIARLPGTGRGESLLFNGHIDTTVPCLGWTRAPHGPEGGVVEGDRLYGHGISNMKASCSAMAAALCALKRSGVELRGDVIASLVMGECDGGLGARHMLKEGLRADYFINGEPTDLQVLLIHAGVCELRIVVKGRSGHFGIVDKGVSAIDKTMKIAAALGKSMAPMGEDGWLKLRKRSPAYEGYPQFNLGAIKGGLTEECTDTGVYNTPDCCIASLNVRYPPGLTPELVKQDMEDALRTLAAEDPDIDATVELDAQFLLPPYESQPDDHVVRAVRDACADVRGAAPTVGALQPMKFMGADSGQIQEAGIPGVMFGVGTFTSSVADEYVELSKVVDLTKIYAVTASRIASSGRAP